MLKFGKECLFGWKKYKHILLLFILCFVFFLARSGAGERFLAVFSEKEGKEAPVIVLDAGHGGMDPGKVGISGVQEKEINLAIAKKLRTLLEQDGVRVVMTRETDDGLYSAESQNKKRDDMKARVNIITEAGADFVVSIHQNSFPSESCKGAQVFYYKDSEESKALAEALQKAFPEVLKDDNRRQAKANSDYFLLRKTACPIVIAECGFLSNASEEALLATEEYQKKVAEALHLGILRYMSEANPNQPEK